MEQSSFEHTFSIGDEVLFPVDQSLEKGEIRGISYTKRSMAETDNLEYIIQPDKRQSQETTRSEQDIVPK